MTKENKDKEYTKLAEKMLGGKKEKHLSWCDCRNSGPGDVRDCNCGYSPYNDAIDKSVPILSDVLKKLNEVDAENDRLEEELKQCHDCSGYCMALKQEIDELKQSQVLSVEELHRILWDNNMINWTMKEIDKTKAIHKAIYGGGNAS